MQKNPPFIFILLISSSFACAQSTRLHFIESGEGWGLFDCQETYGITVADYDNDHDDDLYIGCHGHPPVLYENVGAVKLADRTDMVDLILNNNDFNDRHVAAFADYDGDDDLDMAIITGAVFGSCCGHDQLFNNSAAPWQDVAEQFNIRDSDGSGRYGVWLDYNNNLDLDLFVGHVVYEDTPEKNHNLLYENGSWQNVAAAAGLDFLDNSGTGLATDFDNDRDMDLILTPKYARPGGEPDQNLKFYLNEVPVSSKFQLFECDTTFDYLTVASGDLDNDGDADLVFGRLNHAAEIWLNPGVRRDPCLWQKRRLGGRTFGATATVLGDFDNDGDLDIYFGCQNQTSMAPPSVFLSDGVGAFSEDTIAGVSLWTRSAEIQATWGDFNRDGWVDLVSGAPQVEGFRKTALLLNGYKPDFSTNRSMTTRLLFDKSGSKNRTGIGARVRLEANGKSLTRWIESGGSWHTSLPHYAHFGVGNARTANVSVDWPDGVTKAYNGLTTNECWVLEYASGTAKPCKTPVADISEKPEWVSISVFPNPTTDKIFLSENTAYARIFDPQGKVILEKMMEAEVELDASRLPKGLYFVEVLTNGKRQILKFIKM